MPQRKEKHYHNFMIGSDRIRNIKLLVCDVDGVMTDGQIWLNSKEEWVRRFNVRDGVGILELIKKDIPVAVISAGKSKDVEIRMEFLKIPYVYLGAKDKEAAFLDVLKKTNSETSQCAYIGDDIYDLPLLKKVGFACTVPNAIDSVLESDIYVTKRLGGHGAIREVCDMILKYSQFVRKD